MFHLPSFIYGFLAMSAIASIALLVFDNTESDASYFLAGGPFFWVMAGIMPFIRWCIKRYSHLGEKSVFADENGKLWYCDCKWWDLILNYSNKYKKPDYREYQHQAHLWRDKFTDRIGNYVIVSFRYSPRKFWKNYAEKMSKEDIWACQQNCDIHRGR